jgi:hypothetical protein
MCMSSPKTPAPPPPPAPAAPVPVPELNKADPSMDKSVNALNRKGRSRLRIDLASGGSASEGSGLNIPQ